MREAVQDAHPAGWPALMRDATAAKYLDLSVRALWQGASTGDLPKPLKLPGKRSARWRRDDLDAWVRELAEK